MTSQAPQAPDDERIEQAIGQLRCGSDIERTVFFSDAVFAIAMTLLVLELRVPELEAGGDSHAFAEAFISKIPAFIAFVLSFVIIGTTWLTHHRRFKAIVAYDSRLQALNLTVLFFVAFMPVPTGMLFEHSGGSAIPPILYSSAIIGMFSALDAVWRYAHRAGFLVDTVTEPVYRHALAAMRPVIAVFAVSIPIALVDPTVAELSWVAMGPISTIHGRWQRARFVKSERARLRTAVPATSPQR